MEELKQNLAAARDVTAHRLRRRRVFERARLATVGFGIRWTENPERFPRIIGSGVTVDRRGVVLTARHVVLDLEATLMKETRLGRPVDGVVIVVGSAQSSMVMGNHGEEVHQCSITYSSAQIVATQIDLRNDIAAVTIRGDGLPSEAMVLDYAFSPIEGDPVATCGWPYGTEIHEGKTILSSFLLGTVSAVVPHPTMPARQRQHYLMQLPVNPGNSGGGVFDPDTGELFGVVSTRYAPGGISAGLSVVIPAHFAESVVAQMIRDLENDH